MTVRWRISTPRSRPAALATVDLVAHVESEMNAALRVITGNTTAVGGVTLRRIAGVDHGIVARPSGTHALLMPHGGPAVLDSISRVLIGFGFRNESMLSPRDRFPESRSALEAEVLVALASAPSPLAVDLLLSQPDRWAGVADREANDRDRRLNRLVHPPIVAAVGPPNVGKSSLLNALVGRQAALVADEAGTTRDHIGATVELAGLVVHWVDTPGRRPATGVEARALQNAEQAIEAAHLLIAIGDAASGDPRSATTHPIDIVVAARSDLGRPDWPADHTVSVQAGGERAHAGLADLVAGIRDRLVPPADIASPDPWRFWS
ncbi:MAG: GTPase [Planctomycetota bacterium]